jgi:hypothetical protein
MLTMGTTKCLGLLTGAAVYLFCAIAIGVGVAAWILEDGVSLGSVLRLGAWFTAGALLWSLPFFFQRPGRAEAYVGEGGLILLRTSLLAAQMASWLYFLIACLEAW